MKVRASRFIIAMLMVACAGCAVQGSAYQPALPPSAKSAVYLYRPYRVIGVGVSPSVNCGDYSSALGPGGFHRFTVDPGTLHCDAHTEVTTSIDTDVKPGQSYYIDESLSIGWLQPRVHLDAKTPEEAASEIQECKEQ
jgi:hypothetical protein